MSEAGVVSRSRQLYGDVAVRLRSHGIEIVPFLTVGCLVAGFWCALSLPSIVQAMGLRAEPRKSASAMHASFRPRVQFRVVASVGATTMPELRPTRSSSGPAKRTREPGTAR